MVRRAWTPDEDQLLRRLYGSVPVEDLAARLGRSESSVMHHAEHARLCGCRRLPEHTPKPNAARRADLAEALRWCASFDIVGSDAARLCADACGCTPHMVMLVAARLRK